MIYTPGVITSLTESQTLEQLQDNKLRLVCSALDVDGALLLRSLRKTTVATRLASPLAKTRQNWAMTASKNGDS